jgi:predicted esterase
LSFTIRSRRLAKQSQVALSMQHAGFTNVQIRTFYGGHEIKPAEVQRALRWFRKMGNF